MSLGLYVCLISIGCPHISQALEPAVEVPGGEVAGVAPKKTKGKGKKKGAGKGAVKSRKRQVDELLEEENKENAAVPNADEGQGLLLYKEIDRAYSL